MNYYLRTLEGLGRCLGGSLYDEFLQVFQNYVIQGNARKLSTFNALKYLRLIYPDADFSEIYETINDKYYNSPANYRDVAAGAHEFRVADSRARQAAAAQKQESEKAAAIYRARAIEEAEKQASEMEARRAADYKKQQEAAAQEAAAAIAEYKAQRDEIASNLNYIENGQVILTTPEQQAIYKEITGRDYSEILKHDEEAAAVYESEVERMNEQNIDISPVSVHAEHEYTIIDEDANTITYQDETGAVYVEPKSNKALPWLIAGAAALFLLV